VPVSIINRVSFRVLLCRINKYRDVKRDRYVPAIAGEPPWFWTLVLPTVNVGDATCQKPPAWTGTEVSWPV
jgi:hypothetical protein